MSVADLLQRARDLGLRITSAESCTGGMVAAALTDLPGSSAMFDRGFVTYSNAAKIDMLGVSPATLAAHGAVSEPCAREMAEGAMARAGVSLAVSVTGIAGPGGSAVKPEGRVCFGLAQAGRPTWSETVDFGAPGRAEVRRAATAHALAMLSRALA